MDVVLIANEVIDSRVKANLRGVICKLDIEKAYDYVNWSFVLAVLKKMGFGCKWISWIRWCISIVRFYVLVNGSPSDFFQSSKDLRHRDPLSLCLFILAMEALFLVLMRANKGGFFDGFLVRGRDRGGWRFLICCLWTILSFL